jgi:hypothetical protein
MASALTLNDDDFDAIISEARQFVKAVQRGGDSGEGAAVPSHDLLRPMEVSDDEVEDQWLEKFAQSHHEEASAC